MQLRKRKLDARYVRRWSVVAGVGFCFMMLLPVINVMGQSSGGPVKTQDVLSSTLTLSAALGAFLFTGAGVWKISRYVTLSEVRIERLEDHDARMQERHEKLLKQVADLEGEHRILERRVDRLKTHGD